ncbi:7561_t:CDS:2 [Gigaspora margarita]|uniref:7561_t:CDS:1 n=1 Tax=Gigaspora margarita TaxID=4874 RepID=A0ABN7W2V6_GIGMA|nr:7561_t:CDS:2 [Gigaspora margarita]
MSKKSTENPEESPQANSPKKCRKFNKNLSTKLHLPNTEKPERSLQENSPTERPKEKICLLSNVERPA